MKTDQERSNPGSLPTFNWENFDTFMNHLLGSSVVPDWIIESPLGKSTSYTLPKPSGEGRIEFFELTADLRVIIFDCYWRDPRSIHVFDGDWIRFNFSLSIDIAMQFEDIFAIETNKPSWRIIKTPREAGTIENMPAGEKEIWVTICCKQEMLCQLSGIAADNLPYPLRPSEGDEQEQNYFELPGITERFNGIVVDIIRSMMKGGLRLAYVQTRALELICLALDHVINPVTTPVPVKLFDTDLAALEKARQILLKDFPSPPSIKILSRTIGINRNKLFYGFKSVYGLSIHDFIQEQRLLEGARMLQDTSLSITEIAAEVGFRHQCNFSTAMKRRFDLSPKQIRDKAQIS